MDILRSASLLRNRIGLLSEIKHRVDSNAQRLAEIQEALLRDRAALANTRRELVEVMRTAGLIDPRMTSDAQGIDLTLAVLIETLRQQGTT